MAGKHEPGRAVSQRPSRADLLGAAALALAAVVLWHTRILTPVTLPQQVGRVNGDLYTIYVPLYSFAYRGERLLPAWNPYQLAGTPTVGYLAGGLYYPPNLLCTLLPVHRALGHLMALHLALAAVGTFALSRRLGLSRAAAAVAALSFLCTPLFVGEHLRPMYLFGLAWIPVVSLLAARVVLQPTVAGGAWLGGAMALQFLTGDAQMVCYEAYLLALLGLPGALWMARTAGLRYLARLGASLAVAVAVTLGLSAAQLVPTLDTVSRAVRGFGGLTIAQTLPLRPSAAALRGVGASPGVAILLVPAALLAGRRRAPLVVVCLVAALVTGAIGLGTEAYDRAFHRLPGVALFRLPQQMLIVTGLALAILAGVGLDVIDGRRASRLAAAVAAGAAALSWVALRPELGAGHAGALAVAAAALLILGRWPRARLLALAGLVAVVAVDRFGNTRNTVMTPPANPDAFFATPTFVKVLRQRAGFDRVLVIKNWKNRFPVMEKLGSLHGISVVQDYESLTPTVYRDLLEPLDALNPDRPLFWGRYVAPPHDAGWVPLDLLSTRYVLVAAGTGWRPAAARFRMVYADADVTIYENAGALPRAQLVRRHRVVPDDERALAALLYGDLDPRREVVLDREPPAALRGQTTDAPAVATITRRDLTSVTVRAVTPEPALLVLNDLYWPGWTATVDGAPVEILRANVLFRAVALAPGEHVVAFRYVDSAGRLGGFVSLGTALALLWFGARRVTNVRHTPRHGEPSGRPPLVVLQEPEHRVAGSQPFEGRAARVALDDEVPPRRR